MSKRRRSTRTTTKKDPPPAQLQSEEVGGLKNNSDPNIAGISTTSKWTGDSLCIIETDTYYHAYVYEGVTFAVGDCVFVNVADSADFWVAVIESLWEDQYGEKWFEGRWFYDPMNAYGCSIRVAPESHTTDSSSSSSSSSTTSRRGGNSRKSRVIELPAERELYESDHIDENTVETIAGKVIVYSAHEFRDLLEKSSQVLSKENLFYCQCFYRTAMGMVRPIFEQSTREQRAKLYGNRSKLVNDQRRSYSSSSSRRRSNNSSSSSSSSSRAPSPGTYAEATTSRGLTGTGNKRRRMTSAGQLGAPAVLLEEEEATSKTSAYSKACAALQLSAVPKSLPCREQEREEIMQFIRGGIQHGGLGCALYIAGMPGTGKTATVKEVVHTLMSEADDHSLPPFKHIEINAMKLQRPHETYSLLWRAVSGQHASDHRAALLLDNYFQTPSSKRLVHVVLVDELDYMVTRKQKVLYNLFNWPTYPHSRLVVVGIANTMNLPERLLPRISSRMGLRRVKFKGYTVKQIETIMKARLADVAVFRGEAVEICARLVAKYTGDVRRALQIARRAAEICDREHRTKAKAKTKTKTKKKRTSSSSSSNSSPNSTYFVTVQHIKTAHQELNNAPHVLAIKHTSELERLFLASVVLKLRSTGIECIPFQDVADRFESLYRTTIGLSVSQQPSRSEVRDICHRLARIKILTLEETHEEPSIRMNVMMGEAVDAIRQSEDSIQIANLLCDV